VSSAERAIDWRWGGGTGWLCGFLKVRPWAVNIHTDTFCAAWDVHHRCTAANQRAAACLCCSTVTCSRWRGDLLSDFIRAPTTTTHQKPSDGISAQHFCYIRGPQRGSFWAFSSTTSNLKWLEKIVAVLEAALNLSAFIVHQWKCHKGIKSATTAQNLRKPHGAARDLFLLLYTGLKWLLVHCFSPQATLTQ